MMHVELPMWLVVPVGLAIVLGIFAMIAYVAFAPGDQENPPNNPPAGA